MTECKIRHYPKLSKMNPGDPPESGQATDFTCDELRGLLTQCTCNKEGPSIKKADPTLEERVHGLERALTYYAQMIEQIQRDSSGFIVYPEGRIKTWFKKLFHMNYRRNTPKGSKGLYD